MSSTVSPTGKRLVRSKSGLRIVPLNEQDRSPFELVEPEWVPDGESPTCMECKEKFDFIKRRHHCRRCGRVCCASCCKSKLSLPRMCFLDPVRLCSPCASTTHTENKFYHHHLKSLVSGAILSVSGEDMFGLANCRLSTDHRLLQVDTSDASLNVPLHRLSSIHASKNSCNSESEETVESSSSPEENTTTSFFEVVGNDSCSSVVLVYKTGACDTAGELDESEVSLSAPDDAPSSAYSFLSALQRAALMAIEAKAVIGVGA